MKRWSNRRARSLIGDDAPPPRWHRARPEVTGRTPAHVSIRLRKGTWKLRRKRCFRIVREALIVANTKLRFRVIEYSVQGNHIHLVAEAEDTYALSRAMRGLSIRIAKRINALMKSPGARIVERYSLSVLKTPLAVHLALRYVLNNFRRHAARSGRTCDPGWIDPCSSALWFRGWSRAPAAARDPCPELPRGTSPPRSFLLREAWKAYGAIEPDYVPGPERDRRRVNGALSARDDTAP